MEQTGMLTIDAVSLSSLVFKLKQTEGNANVTLPQGLTLRKEGTKVVGFALTDGAPETVTQNALANAFMRGSGHADFRAQGRSDVNEMLEAWKIEVSADGNNMFLNATAFGWAQNIAANLAPVAPVAAPTMSAPTMSAPTMAAPTSAPVVQQTAPVAQVAGKAYTEDAWDALMMTAKNNPAVTGHITVRTKGGAQLTIIRGDGISDNVTTLGDATTVSKKNPLANAFSRIVGSMAMTGHQQGKGNPSGMEIVLASGHAASFFKQLTAANIINTACAEPTFWKDSQVGLNIAHTINALCISNGWTKVERGNKKQTVTVDPALQAESDSLFN